jgi:hypothetical protein
VNKEGLQLEEKKTQALWESHSLEGTDSPSPHLTRKESQGEQNEELHDWKEVNLQLEGYEEPRNLRNSGSV